MTGIELAVGYLAAWAWQKARRAAGEMDEVVDRTIDASVERLYDTVASKLGDDPALKKLELEAGSDLTTQSVQPRTAQRVQLAIEDAAEHDSTFESEITALLDRIAAEGGTRIAADGSGNTTAGRDVRVDAVDGSVAAGTITGDVNMGTTYRAEQILMGGAVPEESRHQYFVDFHQVRAMAELARLCQTHSATLLCTGEAEGGRGALNAVSRFRRDYYPELRDLISDRDIAIAWTNVGPFYTNFFTDVKESVSTFLKSRGVRFVGCHLFVGDALVESMRADDGGFNFRHAEPYVVVARTLIEKHLG